MDCSDRDDRTAGLGARQRNSVPRRPDTRSDRSPLLLSREWEWSDQGNIEAGKNAKVRHRGHWKKIAVVAKRADSRRSCRGVCPPRQRIYDLGCGVDRLAVSRESNIAQFHEHAREMIQLQRRA